MSKDLPSQARAALESGSQEALALYDRALRSDPGNAMLWLGKARALDLVGDVRGAMIVTRQIAEQAPSLIEAQALLAQLRLAAGDENFASHFAEAALKHPRNPNILAAHIEALAGHDRPQEAAAIAAEARERFPDEEHFALLEAVHAGAAGEWDRADTIFATLNQARPERHLHEARHRLRAGDHEAALQLLDKFRECEPWDVTAWALKGIAWRLAGNSQAEWLHEQEGLVQLRPLAGRAELVEDVAEALRVLHKSASVPLGQSVRGGTQTRGRLLDRAEAVFAELRAAILATLADYRAELPPEDANHPLLRHRDVDWSLAGSWSVRLTGSGDHHVSHIHPQGIVSSALYLALPDGVADVSAKQGWLELGRPPRDLGLELEPLRTIQPQAGHLALFPSSLYHGTTRFGGGSERLTVAFDVTIEA